MEELIFTPTASDFSVEFISGSINVLQYKMPTRPNRIAVYGRIDPSVAWVLLTNMIKPADSNIIALDVPAGISVRIVSDVKPTSAFVKLS